MCVGVVGGGGYVCAPDSVISQAAGAGHSCKKSPGHEFKAGVPGAAEPAGVPQPGLRAFALPLIG